jgi:hypothetical protein
MAADILAHGAARERPPDDAARLDRAVWLRRIIVAAGLAWSAVFAAVGPTFELQLYGDGSIFSYAVAVRDAWTIHSHNIPGRLFVYLYSFAPAEALVAWTHNAAGGVLVYGILRDAAPALGLAATFAADRSKDRLLFVYGCLSTACVCPLVFGFPTEMWMAHALFWPTLAACHFARGAAGSAVVFSLLLALLHTHEGALILAGVILATLSLRGIRDAAFLRAAAGTAVAFAAWLITKTVFPLDSYIVDVMADAELNFFNPEILTGDLMLLISGTLAGYGLLALSLRLLTPRHADLCAGLTIAVALVAYWLWFDQALHAQDRYYLRTILLLATAGLGAVAAVRALMAEGAIGIPLQRLAHRLADRAARVPPRTILVAIMLLLVIHAVETAKFVSAWSGYKNAVRALAMGPESDPVLGDPRFVSSARLGAGRNRLSWSSTTPYLSILLAPNLVPARLVVDPDAGFFWLPCDAARRSELADRAVPVESRRLIRTLECLHRP